ncbi:MAG: response regulator [Thermodesulfobacteriota bacterium]
MPYAPHILIVDDDKRLCNLIEEALSRAGFGAESTQDPLGALEMLYNDRYEIALVDINMPVMDGISLAKGIKRERPDLGIILISGFGNFHNAVEAIKTGVYDFIQKPFKMGDLVLSVKRLAKLLELERKVTAKTEELKKSEERYRTLIENAADGIGLFQNGAIVFHNKALGKILGYGESSLYKWKLLDLIWPDDHEKALQHIDDVSNGTINQAPAKYRLKKQDGSSCWTSVNITLIEYQAKATLIASFRDITPSVEIENMQKDMERMLRHDMRSQLIGIMGFTARLIKHTPLTETQLEYCKHIHRYGVQLENMIETYLHVSKLEQGTFMFNKEEFNFLDAVRHSRDTLRELADKKNVNITIIFNHKIYSLEDKLPFYGDKVYLQNALNNLLKNAIEASPSNMSVKIKVRTKEGYVKVSISNWGTVPEEVRSRFFEKYASFGKKVGIGLGTYMARLVVQGHGGDITLLSSEEDGTSVTWELPYGNA